MSAIIEMIETVAGRLEELRDHVVFVGGATTTLLVTDPAVVDIRPTKDIDIIVEVVSFTNYTELEETLRAKGFLNVVDPTAPICRWSVESVLVDIMPTLSEILGFSNRWYRAAVETGIPWKLPSGLVIQLVRPEYFVATKIEAFLGRGNGDFLLSHDIEDIITVIDGRPELATEIGNAEEEVRSFIQTQIAEFLAHDEFRNAVLGYLSPDNAGQARYETLIVRATRIASREI